MHFLLWKKRSYEGPNFDTSKCSGKNLPNSSCYFQTTCQFFFKFCMTLQCHERYLLCTFLGQTLHTLHERDQSTRNQMLFLSKVHKVWAKNYRGIIFHDTEQWCKVWRNSDLVVSKMVWGIRWSFIRELKSLKNCALTGSFYPEHIMFQLENSIGIMCHDTEGWCKI